MYTHNTISHLPVPPQARVSPPGQQRLQALDRHGVDGVRIHVGRLLLVEEERRPLVAPAAGDLDAWCWIFVGCWKGVWGP